MRLSDIFHRLGDGFYPPGTVYTTIKTPDEFDPNTKFGGTWVLFAAGRTLVSVDPNDPQLNEAGIELGEKTHVLTAAEMPSHAHNYSYANRSKFEESGSGTAHYQHSGYATKATTNAGGNAAHNNMQPSYTVYRWLRTA